MDDRHIHDLIADVRAARLSRRAFTCLMVGFGIGAPIAAQLLEGAGLHAQPRSDGFTPTRRGGGGQLKVLWWQAPTLLNPHFAVGVKDFEAARIFYEPLAGWDTEGNLVPMLAAEIPDLENEGLSRDGMSVTWKLKPNVRWHDGKPFTADDLVFTWEYAADPATAAVAGSAAYSQLKTRSSAVNGFPSCHVTPRLSFQVTDLPSRATPPFSRLGISWARIGKRVPSGSNAASGS